MTDLMEEKNTEASLVDDLKMDLKMDSTVTEAGSNINAQSSAPGQTATAKNYKTTLCQYYLQGPCKNGENCNYAHGTSELRTSSGLPVSELKDGSSTNGTSASKAVNRFKTTLCAKFVTIGSCPFGPACNFAHGVQELRQAAESVAQRENNPNANYKTSLCKNFTQGIYCSFGEKCQYAHGMTELREKPASVPPSLMSEDDKKKRIEKAKKMPGYKTRLCQNYEKTKECEYGEICHYAHGEDEVREATAEDKETMQRGNPFYKTAMCKNIKKGECVNGDQCVYAHSEAELRPPQQQQPKTLFKTVLCKNFMEFGQCNFGMSCQFAHGQIELRRPDGVGYPGHISPGPVHAGGKRMMMYKTQMCQQMMNQGHCPRGNACLFAHSPMEKRPSGGSQPMRPLGIIQKPGQPVKYKTTMCTSVIEQTGMCKRGDDCHFAHSMAELKAGQAADPKFKTELCSNFSTNGYCERLNNCKFAHGQSELRPTKSLNGSNPVLATYGKGNSYPSPATAMSGGGSMKHDNYKTSMCRHAASGMCQRGDACNFAHSAEELRSKSERQAANVPHPSSWQSFDSHANGLFDSGPMYLNNSPQMGAMNHYGGAGPGGYSNDFFGSGGYGKRKKMAPGGGMKTMICQSFAAFGNCQYGDTCMYAHGENEMTVNKRQRF